MEELFWYHSYRVKQVIQDLLPHPLRHNLRNRAGSWNSAQAKLLYTTLPAKSIRLLNINPGLSCENLSCSLEVVKLEDRPPFEALSYVWGKPDPLVEITCNNIAIHITPNLAAALHRIREPLAPKPRKVWVDAICINQDDDLERSSQVMFMKDIYSKAEKVLIWLGETDCGADIFNNAVENIDAMSSIVKWGHGTPAPDQHQIAKTFRKTKHNHESSAKIKQWIESNPSWSIFVQMISAPWFTRVWVLQEFAHAQSITLLTGPHSLSSFSLFLSCIYIHKHRYDLPTPTIAHINRAVRVYDLRFPSHLLPQIETATIFNATDPRDIIFAVLGLPSVEHDRDFDSRSLLRPDYTKPVWEVYGNVVRHFVSAPRVRPFREFIDDPETPIGGERFGEGVLDILRPPELCDLIPDFERDITKGGEFPSWVPRWDLNSEVHRQPPGLWAQDPKFLWEPAGKKDVTYFPPSTNSSLSEEERERENRTLKLKGGKLTSVAIILDEYLLPLSKNERNSPNTVKKLLDIVRGLFTLRSENGNQALRYAGPGSVEGDFAVVVTAGTKRGGTPHPSLRSKSSMSVRRNGSVEALRAGGGDSPAQEIETESEELRGMRDWFALCCANLEEEEIGARTPTPSLNQNSNPPSPTSTEKTLRERSSTSTSLQSSRTLKTWLEWESSSSSQPFQPSQAIPQSSDQQDEITSSKTSTAAERFASSVDLNRTFFVTLDGHLGIGTPKTRVGDEVWVLFGGRVLFVLREGGSGEGGGGEKKKRLFVGECFVCGFMDGEGLFEILRGEVEEEWICLV